MNELWCYYIERKGAKKKNDINGAFSREDQESQCNKDSGTRWFNLSPFDFFSWRSRFAFDFGSRGFHHPKKVTNSQNCQVFWWPIGVPRIIWILKGEVPDLQILGSSWMTVHGWKLLSSHVMTFQLNGPKQCSLPSLPPQKEGIHHPNLGNNSSSEPSIIFFQVLFLCWGRTKTPNI